MPLEVAPHPLPGDVAAWYRREGWWTDETLGARVERRLRRGAGLACVIGSAERPWSGTFGDLLDLARRLAGGLRARGVGPGDPVACQLPNWVEAVVTFYATALLGAVPVPIVHFYGTREVGFALRQSVARVLVTGTRFGHVDFLANLEELRPDLPALSLVAAVGDGPLPAGVTRFADVVDAESLAAPVVADPAGPALLAYTAGTTAEPKGVVHTHRSIVAEVRQLAAVQPGGPPAIVGAPVGHAIGMLAALLLPVERGVPIHLVDVWDPGRVLAAMLADGCTSGSGSTYFLTSLLDHPDFSARHLEVMGHIGLGGAPVPAAVAERADALGLSIARLYGSTEHPSITGSVRGDPRAKRLFTDGHPLPGVELEVRDEQGRAVAVGTPGEVCSRGPDCCAGYTDPALTAAAFDTAGWYRTGDVGVRDPDGYVAIVDRKNDIIIRGGENLSPAEVEEELARLPAVAEVAVVAAPDARLGEHACAFVRLRRGEPAPTLADLAAHLERAGLARQKWPEELRIVPDLPRTASGKVRKVDLRRALLRNDNDCR